MGRCFLVLGSTTVAVLLFASSATAQPEMSRAPQPETLPADEGVIADPEATATSLEGQFRDLERGTRQLTADVGQTYRRIAAIRMSLRSGVDGAVLRITQHNGVGPFYRLVEVSYALDGRSVYRRRDESGALGRPREIAIHQGSIRPGMHTISVRLRYVGDGGELIRYLDGYRFSIRSSHTFAAPAGEAVDLTLRTFARDATVPYVRRLGVEYTRESRPLGRRATASSLRH